MLNSDIFKEVQKEDLVDQFVGGTSIKTTNVVIDTKGGTLFIDECYRYQQHAFCL